MFTFEEAEKKTFKNLQPKPNMINVRIVSSDKAALILKHSLNTVGLKRCILQNLQILLQEVLLI
jgi:predicted DNA binding CopG/RHH family protein